MIASPKLVPSEPSRNNIFNIKVPTINSLISTSSGLVSDIFGYAGNFWDKHKQDDSRSPYEEPEDYDRRSESSSTVIYEESPEILILNRHKIHGRQERFSREFAINLKKLRVGRYSEYMPRRNMQLQIDEDVQPRITTLRESIIEQRKRTESCYPRLQHQKNSNVDPPAISLASVESRAEEILIEPDLNLMSYENQPEDSEPLVESIASMPKALGRNEEPAELMRIAQEPDRSKECKECIEERSEMEEVTAHNSINFPNNFLNLPFVQESRPESVISRSRSIDSISVNIDGKIFAYFNKTQLCSIPVLPFMEYVERLKKSRVEAADPWHKSLIRNKICCYKQLILPRPELESLEKIIGLSQMEFDCTSDFHLILLLGTYTCITGETDWPSSDSEWLNMGFSGTDLQKELKNGGVVGLLFTFSLGTYFPEFIKEMMDVSRYYSFDIFDVCKHFALDAIEVLREKRLHKHMHSKDKALEVLFLFYSGMLMDWFSIIVRNKDFNEVHTTVLSKAKSSPDEYIKLAQKKCTHFPV